MMAMRLSVALFVAAGLFSGARGEAGASVAAMRGPRCALNPDFTLQPPLAPFCNTYDDWVLLLSPIVHNNPGDTQHTWVMSGPGFPALTVTNTGSGLSTSRILPMKRGETWTVVHTVSKPGCVSASKTLTVTIPCDSLNSLFTAKVTWGSKNGVLEVTGSPNPCDTYHMFSLYKHGVAKAVEHIAWWTRPKGARNAYLTGPMTFSTPIEGSTAYYVKRGVWSSCRPWQETRMNVNCPLVDPVFSALFNGHLGVLPQTFRGGFAPTPTVSPVFPGGDRYKFAAATPHTLRLPHSAAVNPNTRFSFAARVYFDDCCWGYAKPLVAKGPFKWMALAGDELQHVELGGDQIHANEGGVTLPSHEWVCLGVTVDIVPSGTTTVTYYMNGAQLGPAVAVPTQPGYPVASTDPVVVNGVPPHYWIGEIDHLHYWDDVVPASTMGTVCNCV